MIVEFPELKPADKRVLDVDDLSVPGLCPKCWRLFGAARALAVERKQVYAIYQHCAHRQTLVVASFGEGWKIDSWTVLAPLDAARAKQLVAESARTMTEHYGKPGEQAGPRH